jgi:hypothetical protein
MKNDCTRVCRSLIAILTLLGGLFWAATGLSQTQQGLAAGDPSSGVSSSAGQRQILSQPLPESVLYQVFFQFVADLDRFADKLGGLGNKKGAAAWHTHAQRMAGLTSEEGEILKRVAYECNQDLSDNRAQAKDALTKFHAQYPDGAFRKLPRPAELTQLRAFRQKIIESHVAQLRSQLSEESLQKLESYMKELFPSVVTTQLSPGSAKASIARRLSLDQGAQ